jgi:hypothetical protein
MDAIKRKLADLLKEMSEDELTEVLDFAGYLRLRRAKSESEYLDMIIEASEEFWGGVRWCSI